MSLLSNDKELEQRYASVQRAKKFLVWIEQNIPKKYRKDSGKTTLEQALWFAAWQEATLLMEDTHRHLAQAVQMGLGPFKNIFHLAEWLDSYEPQTDDEAALYEDVRDFWKEGERS